VSAEQPADTSPEAPEAGAMMERIQGMMGMMEQMQGMMEQMQGMMGMMGRGAMPGRIGMMGRRGMMAEEHDDDQGMLWGGMMGYGHMMGHGGKLLRHLERLIEQLDLTDEQETQVRSLVRTHMKNAIRIRADIHIKRLDLQELLEAESVDFAKVKDLLQTIASQQANLQFGHITLRGNINQLLTPEQKAKFRFIHRHMVWGNRGMMDRRSMMGRGGMQGRGIMRNPCGMIGSGTGKQ
jgi:Spy/CpxP family protein refolding chaperone